MNKITPGFGVCRGYKSHIFKKTGEYFYICTVCKKIESDSIRVEALEYYLPKKQLLSEAMKEEEQNAE